MFIRQVFLNTDFRNSHDGLAAIALNNGIDVSKLAHGEFVLFLNAHKDRIKLYTSNNVLAYMKMPHRHRVEMRTLRLIPEAFMASGRIQYDETLKEVLMKELKITRRRKVEPEPETRQEKPTREDVKQATETKKRRRSPRRYELEIVRQAQKKKKESSG